MKKELNELLKRSHSPYSGVKVSSIVVTKNNKYNGVNIENSSYTPTVCAERVAIFGAIANGEKAEDFVELHLTANTDKPLYPCGVCRQVMSEFFKAETPIFVHHKDATIKTTLGELLPNAVTKESF